MTIKDRQPSAARAVFFGSTSPFAMLRGPQVAYAPEDEHGGGGDELHEDFVEQPGDREPEPGAEEDGAGSEEEGSEVGGEEEGGAEGDEGGAEGSGAEEQQAGGDEGGAEGAAGEGEGPPPKKKDWRDRQIEKLRTAERDRVAELAEAKRRAEAAEALLAAAPEDRETVVTEQTRERMRQEALAEVRQEQQIATLNKNLTALDAAGKTAFPKTWDERVTQVRELMGSELAARTDFLEAITDLPNANAVYHELAGDLDKLEELLALPPAKMGGELVRMSDKLAKPPARQVSRAPAPITPINRHGTERSLEDLMNDPKASQAEINRRMDAEDDRRAKAAR